MFAVRYMTIKRFADWSGYTPDAIRTKVRDGVWREGLEFKRAPDGRVLIDVEEVQRMGGERKFDGVRASSKSTIEIDFYYQGGRCRERIRLEPSPANLKRAAQH